MSFKVGDVCEIFGLLPVDRRYEGMECSIVSRGCFLDRQMEGGPMAWYLTQIKDKKGTDYIHFRNLRLKRPPTDEFQPAEPEFVSDLLKRLNKEKA